MSPDAGPTGARRMALVASLAVLAAATFAGCGGTENQTKINGAQPRPAPHVGHVRLPDVSNDAQGKPVAMVSRKGGLMLVYFGYTYCPDVCPTTLSDLARALKKLSPQQRSRTEVAMVTVDPQRDTPKVLNAYLGHFFSNARALRTTDMSELRSAERAFRAWSRIGRDRKGEKTVEHTARVYAVNGDGFIEVEWPFGTSSSAIASDLRTLYERRTTGT